MKTVDPNELRGLLVRPASLVIRFGDDKLYKEAINTYTLLLDTKPNAFGAVGDYQYCSFQVGNPSDLVDRDIELRLEYRLNDNLASHTVLFWRTKKGIDVDDVIARLNRSNYKKREKDNSGHNLLGEDRCILESPDGELVGGHTNPPFPPGGGREFFMHEHRVSGLGGLLLGVLGGLALATLLPGAFGLRR